MAHKLALITMLLTAVTLTGCGGGGGSSNPSPSSPATPAEEPPAQEPPAEDPPAEEPPPEEPPAEEPPAEDPPAEEPPAEEPPAEEPPAEEPPPATASLELLHGSHDAPAINWFVDGSLVFSSVTYKSGSGFVSVEEGDVSVSAEAVTPTGTEVVIPPTTITVAGDERISIIAAGEYQHLQALTLTAADLEPAPGHARLRVVHAAPNATALDIYATTAPDHDISGASPFATLAFTGDFGAPDVPANTYRIQVTEQGNTSTVLFDSGEIDLGDGADLLIVAVENTGVGDAPISLVVLDGQDAVEVLDVNTPSAARVVHAAPDGPVLDVVIAGDPNPVAWDLIYTDVTPYLEIPAGPLTAQVRNQSTGIPVMADVELLLVPGYAYTAMAIGLMPDLEPLVLVDDNRRVATEARLRFVHATPAGGAVDIYVTPAGINFEDTTPAFPGAAFASETGYVGFQPGEYTVTVTAAGTQIPEATLAINANAHGIYTAVLGDQVGGGTPLQFILMDDLVP